MQQKQSGGQQLTSQWELLMAQSKGLQWVWAPDGATHPRDKHPAISRMAIMSQQLLHCYPNGCASWAGTGAGVWGENWAAVPSPRLHWMPHCLQLATSTRPFVGVSMNRQHFGKWSPAWLWASFLVGGLWGGWHWSDGGLVKLLCGEIE